ncbi:MAG: TlyA family RNA methyltransferase [Candidatus Bipolaricaulota bacterium]|nr:TlyA family RNA methyltransferase [Candidatus Bipolaricaulota bacterium]MDW8111265.1 TlyA family RNA methyltransferase [Candidatus Bipolaricaulota bacterium]
MSHKRRLDLLLVERGLYSSRAQAQRAISAGLVLVNGELIDKPGAQVSIDAQIEVKETPRYVSQGGLKLEKALDVFQIDATDKTCLDIGASTGGFTDCLLQHGAKRVYAIDVGKGQLDWKLRTDPRVTVLEEINARYLKPEQIGELVDLATVDVSFISLKLILPPLKEIVTPKGDLICLVKPQFEAGRKQIARGGVVKDSLTHQRVLEDLARFIEDQLQISIVNATFSPIRGPAGNIEFFFHIKNEPHRSCSIAWAALVAEAHRSL